MFLAAVDVGASDNGILASTLNLLELASPTLSMSNVFQVGDPLELFSAPRTPRVESARATEFRRSRFMATRSE